MSDDSKNPGECSLVRRSPVSQPAGAPASAGGVRCDYCGNLAQLVTGETLHPHRPDLYALKAWVCWPCDARVGCHDGTDKPKGTFANPQRRALRIAVHRLFDPLWQQWRSAYPDGVGAPDGALRRIARNRAYAWLTDEMGATDQVHIGEFDEALCEQAISILRSQKPTPASIRAWAKQQDSKK